jgi:hypothetical protein
VDLGYFSVTNHSNLDEAWHFLPGFVFIWFKNAEKTGIPIG